MAGAAQRDRAGRDAGGGAARSSLGVEATPINLREAPDIERSVAAFARSANGGLIVVPGGSASFNRGLIVALAARHRLPAVYPGRHYVSIGGLISYEPDYI